MAIETYADTFFSNLFAYVQANLAREVGVSFYDFGTFEFVAFAYPPLGCPILLIDLNEVQSPFYSKVSGVVGAHASGGTSIEFDPVPPASSYLMLTGVRQATEATPYAKAGGTGVTTEAGLVDLESQIRAITFVDFEGAYTYSDVDKNSENGATTVQVVTKFRDFYIIDFANTGGQRVTFGHNSNSLFSDGTCPGVACIEVIDVGDIAAIAGYACRSYEGAFENFRVKQGLRFWIDSENTDDDEIQISIGFTNGKDGYVDGDGPIRFMPGNSFHYNYNEPRHADGSHLIEQILTSDASGAGPSVWTVIPFTNVAKWPKTGRWISVDMYYDNSTDTGQCSITGSSSSFNLGNSTTYYGPDPVRDIIPMIFVKKKKGNKSMKVYVDYIYYGVVPE